MIRFTKLYKGFIQPHCGVRNTEKLAALNKIIIIIIIIIIITIIIIIIIIIIINLYLTTIYFKANTCLRGRVYV